MQQRGEIEWIKISLMDPQKTKALSSGEVTVPKTICASTLKPVMNGLSCQRIFGPVERGVCACGRYHKDYRRSKIQCDSCKVVLNDPIVRRKRFGHINLTVPVVHPWFRKYISLLLNIPPKILKSIIECETFVVTKKGKSTFRESETITAREYFNYKFENQEDEKFHALTGGDLLKRFLSNINIDLLVSKLKKQHPSRRVNRRLITARNFLKSEIKPEWMILDTILVLPADLRPVLVLQDGTIASSDINELYAKIIIRNNRLKNLLKLKSPEIMVNAGRSLVQKAVDALIENGKTGNLKTRGGNRLLKSLSSLIEGKEGRIRRNLLGKRVDFSGRSVIVAGPELKLNQCGLPIDLAMDIYRPFVYSRLLRIGYASSLKHARAIIEAKKPEALEALEYVLEEGTVFLNRAPSLHRMSIQAFEPVLINSKALKLHPLVCASFNADFDGDQMGVHAPVTLEAQIEARILMLSLNNILSPASGKLLTAPSHEIVLGIYYLTKDKGGCRGEGKLFSDKEEVELAYENGIVELHSRIKVRMDNEKVETTPGRIIFHNVFPSEVPFQSVNKLIRKKDISKLIEMCYEAMTVKRTAELLDRIKEIGFKYATASGISLCMDDITIPRGKEGIISRTEGEVKEVKEEFEKGMITESEKHNKVVSLWMKASEEVAEKMMEEFGVNSENEIPEEEREKIREFNSFFMMADSGARGSKDQIKQVAGMRGLMVKPTGDIVETPIKSNFKEGLSCNEYLLSCHGARKGRADGALKTANAGHFTRKLVDVAHDIVINAVDCGATKGISVYELRSDNEVVIPLEDRIMGRVSSKRILHPVTKETMVEKNELISKGKAERIRKEGIQSVEIRSPVTCTLESGICAMCYGVDLSRRKFPEIGDAVGIIAAQSIGEPGTQLTLRTFHTGGSAAGEKMISSIISKKKGIIIFKDIKGVRRKDGRLIVFGKNGRLSIKCDNSEEDLGKVPYGAVLIYDEGEEIEEGKKLVEWDPYFIPVITAVSGKAVYEEITENVTMRKEIDQVTGITRMFISNVSKDLIPKIKVEGKEYPLQIGTVLTVGNGDDIHQGDIIARIPKKTTRNIDITGGLGRVLQILEVRKLKEPAMIAEIDGEVKIIPAKGKYMNLEIKSDDGTARTSTVSIERQINVHHGEMVKAGDILVDGVVDTKDIMRVLGIERTALHIMDEVQKVYKSHGVEINDKHLEVIIRKMVGKVMIAEPGDTDFITGEIVSKNEFIKKNMGVNGKKAKANPIVVGITKAALLSESWLSAASFQSTTSVLAEAAIRKDVDYLKGLKENIIVGNMVPIGAGHKEYRMIHTPTRKPEEEKQREQREKRYQKFLSIFKS